jgi:uncharacterized protein
MRPFIPILFVLYQVLIPVKAQESDFLLRLSNSALELTKQNVTYDPSYSRIEYPKGDIPSDKGVCTDVIIRAYRELGIDL